MRAAKMSRWLVVQKLFLFKDLSIQEEMLIHDAAQLQTSNW